MLETQLQCLCLSFLPYSLYTSLPLSFFRSGAEPTGAGLPSLCGESGETSEQQYVSDKGAASSLLLALRPEHGKASSSSATSCKRQFRAPDAYNFFVRMQRIPGQGPRSTASRKYNGNKSSNSTHSCPLTIVRMCAARDDTPARLCSGTCSWHGRLVERSTSLSMCVCVWVCYVVGCTFFSSAFILSHCDEQQQQQQQHIRTARNDPPNHDRTSTCQFVAPCSPSLAKGNDAQQIARTLAHPHARARSWLREWC